MTTIYYIRDGAAVRSVEGRGFWLSVRHVDDGQRNTDLPCLVRSLLQGVQKDRTVGHDDWVTKELKFLAVESHLVLLGKA